MKLVIEVELADEHKVEDWTGSVKQSFRRAFLGFMDEEAKEGGTCSVQVLP